MGRRRDDGEEGRWWGGREMMGRKGDGGEEGRWYLIGGDW